MNKAILIGRLGRDPETRYTRGGQAVANFSVATDDTYLDSKPDGVESGSEPSRQAQPDRSAATTITDDDITVNANARFLRFSEREAAQKNFRGGGFGGIAAAPFTTKGHSNDRDEL